MKFVEKRFHLDEFLFELPFSECSLVDLLDDVFIVGVKDVKVDEMLNTIVEVRIIILAMSTEQNRPFVRLSIRVSP